MRKNKLIEEMNKVIEKNNRLFEKCEELQATVSQKDESIEELKIKVASLEAEIELLKAVAVSVPDADLKDEITVACDAVDEHNAEPEVESATDEIEIAVEEPKQSVDENAKISIPEAKHNNIVSTVLPETALKLASEAIGRVVVKCAELCNHFASIGSPNSKDLVNLALGRTEVFKSDLLSLISDNEQNEETLSSEIERREADVVEYFDLLLSQL